MNETVKFVLGSRVLDVMNDCVQHVNTERTWSQLLVEGRIDDPLENGDDSPEFVAVGDHLCNGPVHTEVESSLDFELSDFIADVIDHLVQLM